MSEPRMTKGYARVVCENGHDVWGGETVEEAQKYINAQCWECEESEENTVRYDPPRIVPPTEADTLRFELDALKAQVKELREALAEVRSDVNRAAVNNVVWPNTLRAVDGALANTQEIKE